MIFRVLDIETIVDDAFWTRGETRYRVVPSPLATSQLAAEAMDDFPPPHASRVVALSCVDVRFDAAKTPRYYLDRCWTHCRWGATREEADECERSLLLGFAREMAEAAASDVHLVTWNGRSFDLPVIVLRSLLHKISAPWYYKSRDVRYRYSAEGHLDLMDFLSDYGASRCMKMGDAARLCGLPGKTDTSGEDVALLHAEAMVSDQGRDAEIRARVARYCQQDTIQTALLFVRSRHLLGKLTPESHDATVETFRSSPEVAAAIEIDWDRLMLCPPGGGAA
jgi:hypothetical protein